MRVSNTRLLPLATAVWSFRRPPSCRRMNSVLLLRVSVHERISAAAEDFLLPLEKAGAAVQVSLLRPLLTERLAAAAEEVVALFDTTVSHYQTKVRRAEKEVCRQREALATLLKTGPKPQRPDVLKVIVGDDELKKASNPEHSDQEARCFKEEDTWSGQEEEGNISVHHLKSESDEDQPLRLPHTEPASSTSHSKAAEPLFSCGTEDETSRSPDLVWLEPGCHPDNSNFAKNSCDPIQSLTCSQCGKLFSSKSSVTKHMRIHTGEKPFSCIFCNACFTQRQALERHLRTHTGVKPFPCAVCDKRFTQKSHMLRHMMTHTGEKPFSCAFCDRVCAEKADLKEHMRVHTGEKPFVCSICGTGFSQRQAMIRHIRTHTGVKPHLCLICGKSFSQKSHMMRHMATHDGKNQILQEHTQTHAQTQTRADSADEAENPG